jgi:anhydro-N-acetylmuramic acid kinase
MTAIGLMSGTSMDGIDVALVATDGERRLIRKGSLTYPYALEQRGRIEDAVVAAWRVLGPEGGEEAKDRTLLAEVEQEVTAAHAAAVKDFLETFGLPRAEVTVLGFPGQTVYHDAARRITRQLGDGEALARATGIDVVYDFRAADMAAGGEGAPVVPVYHRALAEESGIERPLAIVNLGGVANVTFVGADGMLVAFDVGPGNSLLDAWVVARTGAVFDAGGALARDGRPDLTLLEGLLAHPFFARRPPKSLDRRDFAPLSAPGLSTEDGLATLVAFTAQAIAAARDWLPAPPRLWLLAGGGARNAALVEAIGTALDEPVVVAEEMGWSIDHLEAEAFAYLAVRSLKKLPLTFPGTTGVKHPLTGGRLARAPRR